ncbi:hypothetical protein [Mesorhizobium sp. B4-1-4]|uniref:hypothetical protein n=1 Tax=Mesorhizobium sp. B4-1-4 TaxID=2589888 RepID=UPI001D0340A5|nr:hypothetical protein [Mesorhizobium sp. B4-1-4]UCI31027.1 hypothetical protein FJW03_25100 [Mesorhizobium sp. B4-1-4]
MRSRWTILAVLFVARAAMAFQFQSVGAVAPLAGDSLGASLADIGDKAIVLAGLLMMMAGEWHDGVAVLEPAHRRIGDVSEAARALRRNFAIKGVYLQPFSAIVVFQSAAIPSSVSFADPPSLSR